MTFRFSYILSLFVLIAFAANAQMLNIKLESAASSKGASSSHANPENNEAGSTDLSPLLPSAKRVPFTTITEFYEDSPRGGLEISYDLPTVTDYKKVAANNKSNFRQVETGTIFPFQIGDFERTQLKFFVEKPRKVEASYKSAKNKSTMTISLIPETEATEGRLRNEYLTNIKLLSKETGKNYFPKPVFLKFRGIRYINNGVEGTYVNDEKSFSQVRVFECGSWLLVTKINMEGVDEAQFQHFSEELTRYFNPSKLTGVNLMNLKPNVNFDTEALKDTVVTGAMVASAFKKIDWATENISEKERYSGFPDIYLDMHTESLKEYLKILGRKKSRSKVPENFRFYADLKSISDAGYLAEFVMETYENVMIVPNYVDLDFAGYKQWKQDRELGVDLLKKRYKINYRALPY